MRLTFALALLLCSLAAGDKADRVIRSITSKVNELGTDFIRKDYCTAIAVGPKATVDGSTFTTHTDDNENGDFRANKVPARDWPEGSQRAIRQFNSKYPKMIIEDRGATWQTSNLEVGYSAEQHESWVAQKDTRIIGYIPQVPHTYALVESQYAIMNEHQVAIGESTCGARFAAAPVSDPNGFALLDVMELTQLGLERGKTAREAIEVMGSLAEKYGYYGCEWHDHPNPLFGHNHVLGEAGEGLTVVDPKEAWLFHILPDPTGKSAIWVAQRLPDDHIAVIANSFVIHEVPRDDPENFLYSKNMFNIAEENGWWSHKSGKLLDFTDIYGFQRFHDDLSSMRVWHIFDMANPDLKLQPSSGGADSVYIKEDKPYEKQKYPTTIPVGHKLSLDDIISFNRDHFEGTPFSTAEGLASGPYGDPTRYDPAPQSDVTLEEVLHGEYERVVSIHRTLYSTVCQPRAHRPDAFSLLWFGVYTPDQTTYYPIYINSDELAPSYTRGSMHKFDDHCAWWVVSAAGNYANRFYKYSMRAVRDVQRQLHDSFKQQIEALESDIMEQHATKKGHVKLTDEVVDQLTAFTVGSGELITKTYRELIPVLFTKYRDGYVVSNVTQKDVRVGIIGYPRYWMEATGYWKSVGVKGGSWVGASPISTGTGMDGEGVVVAVTNDGMGYATVMVALASFLLGGLVHRCLTKYQKQQGGLGGAAGGSAGRGGYQYSYVEIPSSAPAANDDC